MKNPILLSVSIGAPSVASQSFPPRRARWFVARASGAGDGFGEGMPAGREGRRSARGRNYLARKGSRAGRRRNFSAHGGSCSARGGTCAGRGGKWAGPKGKRAGREGKCGAGTRKCGVRRRIDGHRRRKCDGQNRTCSRQNRKCPRQKGKCWGQKGKGPRQRRKFASRKGKCGGDFLKSAGDFLQDPAYERKYCLRTTSDAARLPSRTTRNGRYSRPRLFRRFSGQFYRQRKRLWPAGKGKDFDPPPMGYRWRPIGLVLRTARGGRAGVSPLRLCWAAKRKYSVTGTCRLSSLA
jgi:hypothetical protein